MKKSILAIICLITTAGIFAQPSWKKLHDISKAETGLNTIIQDKEAKEKERDAQELLRQSAVGTLDNYHIGHGDKPTPEQKSTCEGYEAKVMSINNTLTGIKDEVTALAARKKEKEDTIYNLKVEFAAGMKSPCASSLAGTSTYNAFFECWKCFWDGACNDLPDINGVTPPIGTRVYKNEGTPGSFNSLSEAQKQKYKAVGKEIPAPEATPPQNGIIEQATDKVRAYFRNVINNSDRLKRRVTGAVLAVRG